VGVITDESLLRYQKKRQAEAKLAERTGLKQERGGPE
jgi:hypothetical protein